MIDRMECFTGGDLLYNYKAHCLFGHRPSWGDRGKSYKPQIHKALFMKGLPSHLTSCTILCLNNGKNSFSVISAVRAALFWLSELLRRGEDISFERRFSPNICTRAKSKMKLSNFHLNLLPRRLCKDEFQPFVIWPNGLCLMCAKDKMMIMIVKIKILMTNRLNGLCLIKDIIYQILE